MMSLLATVDAGEYIFLLLTITTFFLITTMRIASQQCAMRRLAAKMDALLQHRGVVIPSTMSDEVQNLARYPATMIKAIQLHRKQTGLGLADAKAEVEAFSRR